jgi:hypothetical protein
MCFLGHSARNDATANHGGTDRAIRAPREIDLAADEWNEVEPPAPAEDRLGVSTILSFWAIAALLLLVIVAAPAFEAAAHRLH